MSIRILLVAAAAATGLAWAQGSLDPPPGGPQRSMKTLLQVEPRLDLFNAPPAAVDLTDETYRIVIRQSGSYYLSSNLGVGGASIGGTPRTSGILINASGVTLDLNGFSVYGVGGLLGGNDTGTAIRVVEGARGVTIRNGSIRGRTTVSFKAGPPASWELGAAGFQPGLAAGGAADCRFADLQITGCRTFGLVAGERSLVANCQLAENNFGMLVASGTVRNCVVSRHYQSGITGEAIVLDCEASENRGSGVEGSVIRNCRATYNNSTGLSGESVADSIAAHNNGDGIRGTVVVSCQARENGGDGVEAAGSVRGCISDQNGGHGFRGGRSLVGCSASGNAGNGFELVDEAVVNECHADGNVIGFNGSSVTLNGCAARGNSGSGFVVNRCDLSDCHARSNGGSGFTSLTTGSSYRNCKATGNGGYGFLALAASGAFHECQALFNSRSGISAGSHSIIRDCLANDNGEGGIVTVEGTTVRSNVVSRNGLDGIRAGAACRVVENGVHANGRIGTGGGILLPLATIPTDTLVWENHVTQNDFGIRVEGDGNLIFRNNASGNGAQDYDINVFRNDVGMIVYPKQDPFNGFEGIVAFDPWVNFRITPPDTVHDP